MRLTVFTPTYNRKDLLKRVYQSLIRQTVKDFEWLVVDDGSTDGTEEEVRKWEAEAVIPVRYYYRENGGKMRAHNTGVSLSAADLFVCLDSDDRFCDTAVADLLKAYDDAKAKEDPDMPVGGVVAHKGRSETELFGDRDFPDVDVSTLYGLYLKGFGGETTLMYETRLLSDYPFPEIEGEKYVPEDYIYDKIDKVCVLAVLPRIVTVCETVPDGYTRSVRKLKHDNVNAFYLYYEQRARITPPGLLRLKYLGRYIIFAGRSAHRISPDGIGKGSLFIGYIYAAFLLLMHRE